MRRRDDSRRTTPEQSRPGSEPAASEALPAASMQAQAAAELNPLGLMLSSRRCILWCNRRFAELFGYAPEELLGQSLAMLYPSEVEYRRIGDRGLRVMQQSAEYQDERLMKRRDGLLQWFRVHGRAEDRADPFLLASWVFEPLAAGVDTDRLTPREREVLAGMARGLTAKLCAKELGISPRTVEKLRARLRERFGAHNAAELMSRVGGLPH